ncbi:helix-turn-helix domain-containing protein [Ferroplasma sp.]|uniref:helix-turn-helix domain-containing protein n=1 Tax=Ferroplasma sp. TaxID=2591003 RepID=UPI0026213F49|nr:helix-turn-helix domain-containing protein [Ferroplasma sp.]MCL4452840.1 helix-turn-helix domain-containing protein [Candidatus Thermoplasmatota archaeon]
MQILYSFKYEKCFASQLISDYNVRIKIVNQELRDNYVYETLAIYAESEDLLDKSVEYLENYPHSYEIEIVGRENNCVTVNILTKSCPLVELMRRKLMSPSNKIKLERIDYSGNIFWEMNVNNYNKIRHIDESLKETYDIKDSNIRIYNGRHINVKSEYILKEAFERGYFDVPKKIGLKELSSTLDIPPTTLDLLLRRQLRQVIQKTIK